MIDKYVEKTYKVDLQRVEKHLGKLPFNIATKLRKWVRSIEKSGLPYTQNIPSYRDKSLSGKRLGQRSIRLNRSYRAFYTVDKYEKIVSVMEVNKHEY